MGMLRGRVLGKLARSGALAVLSCLVSYCQVTEIDVMFS
jgi:hypothetical protein